MDLPKIETWWCNTHQRLATDFDRGEVCCDRKLGGIMIPCRVVDLTGIAQITKTPRNKDNDII